MVGGYDIVFALSPSDKLEISMIEVLLFQGTENMVVITSKASLSFSDTTIPTFNSY
jgi:hypothetical protein